MTTIDFRTTDGFTSSVYDLDGVTVTGSGTVFGSPHNLYGSIGIDDGRIHTGETITFTFDGAVNNVSYFVNKTTNGYAATIEAFGVDGTSLGTQTSWDGSGIGNKDVSQLFGGVPISKFQVSAIAGAAFGIATLSFTPGVPNQPPTAVNFSNTTTALDETTSTATRIKVADVTVTDDGQGTNFLILGGSDANAFELDGTVLYLKAGTTLDYESGKTSYNVTVGVDDVTAGGVIDASKTFTLSVNDVVENTAPTATGETVSTSKNTAVTVELGDNIADAQTLTGATLTVSSSSNGTTSIDQDARLVTFTPTAGFSGTASFNYTITDADGLTSTPATVTVEIGDIISTGNKNQNIQGNNGNDSISAGNGKDILQGLGGNDTLLGNNGADTIDGGSGDDLINGGNGPDLLTGGSGRDKFVLSKSAGGDTITDFADGSDWIALTGGLSFGQLTITGSNGNTLIQSGSETLATLTGVNASLITSADFVTV